MRKKYMQFKEMWFEGLRESSTQHDWEHFRECLWSDCRFNQVEWNHCRFNYTSFTKGTFFTSSRFVECRFWGQHTHLSGPSEFIDCVFENCEFWDVTFWGAVLRRCKIEGSIKNVSFFGPESPLDWQTEFHGVDLVSANLEQVDFRCGFDLSTTSLPIGFEEVGLRK